VLSTIEQNEDFSLSQMILKHHNQKSLSSQSFPDVLETSIDISFVFFFCVWGQGAGG
jgi:hypothetical protein